MKGCRIRPQDPSEGADAVTVQEEEEIGSRAPEGVVISNCASRGNKGG